jgi:hypothetical protein
MASPMSTEEMEKLAQKLAKMNYAKAKGHLRGLDKHGIIELFRTAVGVDKWITRFALPTQGILVSLVEIKEDFGAPNDRGYRQSRFKYVEAIVEPMPENRTNDNRGNSTRSASLPLGSTSSTERLIGKPR